MTEYIRTRRGRMVHRRNGCTAAKQASSGVPWHWASGKDFPQLVAAFTDIVGMDRRIAVCGNCFTFGEREDWHYRVQGGIS